MRRELICADCLEHMRTMPDRSVDLAFTSSPYEDRRMYGCNFKLRGQKWVDWMIPRMVEMCRVSSGLVFLNAAGPVRKFRYSPTMEWLVADLTRNCGLVCGPAPYVFMRVGIPGSGGPAYQARLWEPVYGFCLPDRLPLQWTDNTAFGHPPKFPPGGQMSNRNVDGTRKNNSAGPKAHARWNYENDPWRKRGRGNGIGGFDGRGRKVGDNKRNGKMQSRRKADSSRPQDGDYHEPKIANPGNIVQETYTALEVAELIGEAANVYDHGAVGGGLMGHDLAHESPAPFPVDLPERFVCWFCPPGGTVLDPFVGSGTVPEACMKHGRGYIGIDVEPGKGGIDTARRRLATVTPGMFA